MMETLTDSSSSPPMQWVGCLESVGFVFLMRSHVGVCLLDLDVNLQPTPAITFIAIGGIIDFYLFTGPKPEEVIAQYTDVIGKPFMPSYFTLGFHLCRWRYDNDTKLMEVIKRNRAIQIPYVKPSFQLHSHQSNHQKKF